MRPRLGAYSETWPLKCPKSDKIVRGFAEDLAQPDSHKGFYGFSMLVLLATGEDEDLEVVRNWARSMKKQTPGYAWHLGFGGMPLCEYYLRTGDQEVEKCLTPEVFDGLIKMLKESFTGYEGVKTTPAGLDITKNFSTRNKPGWRTQLIVMTRK